MITFMGAFFSYVQSMRYFHHVNYLINLRSDPSDCDDPVYRRYVRLVTPEFIGSILVRAMNYYTLGIRFYYFAFPTLLWIFGPIPMLVSTLFIVAALFMLDASPKPYQIEEDRDAIALEEGTTPSIPNL